MHVWNQDKNAHHLGRYRTRRPENIVIQILRSALALEASSIYEQKDSHNSHVCTIETKQHEITPSQTSASLVIYAGFSNSLSSSSNVKGFRTAFENPSW